MPRVKAEASETTLTAQQLGTLDLRYLKLDQTTPQHVDNGSPEFNAGLTIKAGQKLILDGN